MKKTNPTSIQTPQQTSKRNREDKENSILNAACEIFSQKGFELATTKEIAQKAGCAEGLIFKYFEGKSKLLLRLMEKGMIRAQQELLHLPEKPNSLEEDLTIIATWLAKSFCKERKIFQIFLSLRLSGDTYITKSLIREEFIKTRNQIIMTRLKKHQTAGHITANINIQHLFELMHSYVNYIGVMLPAYHSDEVLKDVDAKIKQFIHTLIHGLSHST